MKHEWKKAEKHIYLPKEKAELITIPPMKFFTIHGSGNPNDEAFGEYIGVLYSLAYGVKMSIKGGFAPADYFEYAVYPLEGVWDLNEEGRESYSGVIDKNTLVFDLMIRQPEFVSEEFAAEIIERTKKKKPHRLLEDAKFKVIEEGKCVQRLHIGSYDEEPKSFKEMNEFCIKEKLMRTTMKHREIYLSDARKTAPAKLKTVLRIKVKDL